MGAIVPVQKVTVSEDVFAGHAARPENTALPQIEHLLAECVLDIVDQSGRGGVLLDATGHVMRVSRCARSHIGRGIALVHGRLVAGHRDANAALQRLIGTVLRPELRPQEVKAAVALPRSQGRPLIAQAMPMVGSGPATTRHPKAILTLADPDENRIPSESILRQAFGLTPAEVRIAIGLCRGQSPQEIANAHGVNVSTVRIQLKTVYAKTETRRQAELVALLIRLALIDVQAQAGAAP